MDYSNSAIVTNKPLSNVQSSNCDIKQQYKWVNSFGWAQYTFITIQCNRSVKVATPSKKAKGDFAYRALSPFIRVFRITEFLSPPLAHIYSRSLPSYIYLSSRRRSACFYFCLFWYFVYCYRATWHVCWIISIFSTHDFIWVMTSQLTYCMTLTCNNYNNIFIFMQKNLSCRSYWIGQVTFNHSQINKIKQILVFRRVIISFFSLYIEMCISYSNSLTKKNKALLISMAFSTHVSRSYEIQ